MSRVFRVPFDEAVCAVIGGLEHWTQIQDFAKANQDWFKTFLDLPGGIPSHDTFGKVFSVLNPDVFELRIQQWIHCLVGSGTQQKHIAIDGKTLRKSFDTASGKAAIHMLNAYVYDNHAVFGQLKVDSKTNESTAIPRLLEMLELKEATVTIDAMGCQKEIAQKIIDKQGHYVFSLKGNQGTLQEEVRTFMDDRIAAGPSSSYDYYEATEKSHGRIEIRKCWTCGDVAWLSQKQQWPGLSCLAAVECTRIINEKRSTERRYFISSHSGRTDFFLRRNFFRAEIFFALNFSRAIFFLRRNFVEKLADLWRGPRRKRLKMTFFKGLSFSINFRSIFPILGFFLGFYLVF